MKIRVVNDDGVVKVSKISLCGDEQMMFPRILEGESVEIDIDVANISVQAQKYNIKEQELTKYEVVCSKHYLDVGLCTEKIPFSSKPKKVMSRNDGNITYYGGVDLVEWINTGVYLTEKEWRVITRGKSTAEIISELIC